MELTIIITSFCLFVCFEGHGNVRLQVNLRIETQLYFWKGSIKRITTKFFQIQNKTAFVVEKIGYMCTIPYLKPPRPDGLQNSESLGF